MKNLPFKDKHQRKYPPTEFCNTKREEMSIDNGSEKKRNKNVYKADNRMVTIYFD